MTAHERILATMHRQHTDRVPVDVWLTPEVLDSLKKHTGEPDEYEVYKKLGVDKIAWIFPGYGTDIFDPNDSVGTDPWGRADDQGAIRTRHLSGIRRRTAGRLRRGLTTRRLRTLARP